MIDQFKKDIIEGLSKQNKTLPSKYFYDKKGDKLFQQIMAMPEYYLTNAEMDIFQNKTLELIQALKVDKNTHFELIELGAGDGTKTIHLLRALIQNEYDFKYLPVDISQNALDGLETMLGEQLPELNLETKQGDYFEKLNDLKQSNHPKIVLVLGSNIGNLLDHQATKFIYNLGKYLSQGDRIILGVDLIKGKEIVLPAYNDAQGITAEFNLNLLDRINCELGANFNRNQFVHQPDYDEVEGIAKSYLVSLIDQKVNLNGNSFSFVKGEKIHTEISRKYNDQILNEILSETDIKLVDKITDQQNLFADYILERQ